MGWKPSHGLRRFGRYGFPFLISIVGASFALAEFTESRYIYSSRQVQQIDDNDLAAIKFKRKPFDLEAACEEAKRTADAMDWEQKRLLHPGEDKSPSS